MKDLKSRDLQYTNYITEHTTNVIKAYEKYGQQLCEMLNIPLEELKAKCAEHDKSKYSPEEFNAYRDYFHPIGKEPTEEDKAKMDLAFLHHQNINPHHPEYWVLVDNDLPSPYIKVLPMSNIAIAEMLCDWVAMGMKFNGTPYRWLESRKKYYLQKMHPDTFKKVSEIVEKIWKGEKV